jgi:Malectin domain
VQGTTTSESVEAERSELESVAASLARAPKLEQLLRYLAGKYFEGEAEHLTEYNIATDVFGRKKTEFIASQDAIARVETRRLRKKLTAFYENEGADHAIHISIPLGTYVPSFTGRASGSNRTPESRFAPPVQSAGVSHRQVFAEVEPILADPGRGSLPPKHDASQPQSSGFRSRFALFILAALAVALVTFGVFRLHFLLAAKSESLIQRSKQNDVRSDASKPLRLEANSNTPLPSVSLPFRMIAGYAGAPQRDNNGETWQPDSYFHEGWHRQPSQTFIARTSNALIFRYGREGDFSYDIPLAPGNYELHLYFMQPSATAQSEDAENKAIFNVTINGVLTLSSFDIVSDAMGRNTADERVLRDVSPSPDGLLHIRLSTVLGTPSLNAIQILSGTHQRQLPTRIVMQPSFFTDKQGQLWRPDDYFLSGRYLSHDIPGTDSGSDTLPFERFGHFTYAIPVDSRDKYTVVLYFDELYFGAQARNIDGDQRLFRVICNGQTLLNQFDIFKEAGAFHTLKKVFYHIEPTAQGKLNIDFEPVSNYATVSAIEVLDESN